MTVVQQIVFTREVERWWSLAEALGFTAVQPPAPEWSEFSAGGRLAIHHLSNRTPGEIDLCLLVDDLEAAQVAVSALEGVGVERRLLEGVGEMVLVTASTGVVVAVFAGGEAAPVSASPISVQPIWFDSDLAEPRAILEALAMTVELSADSGRWIEVHGASGSVGLHQGERPGLGLSFQADQLDPIQVRLVAAGFESALIDEAYGRSLRIQHAEGEVWINERQHDLYGYSRP